MEAELQRSQERAQLALAASGVEAVELDLGARLIHVGPRWAGILGLPGPGPVPIGPSFPRVRPGPAHADDWPALQAQLAEVLAGRAESIEATSRVIGPDARTHWLELRGRVAERGSDGAPLRLFGTLRDVTEGKALQARLEVADRLAAVGTLAAGVAHEINTPLTYVVTNLALLAERLATRGAPRGPAAPGPAAPLGQLSRRVAEVREHVDALVPRFVKPQSGELGHDLTNALTPIIYKLTLLAEDIARLPGVAPGTLIDHASAEEVEPLLHQTLEGVERVRSIVRDLKTFSHPDEDSLALVDLRRVLTSSINLASSQIRHRARLHTDLSPAPTVRANERRLSQIFVNLLVNAAQAIPDGGADRHEIRVALHTDEAGRAVVEVHDTGTGIAPEHLPRLFDPFFTTKPVGEGTGLGLAICHGIVSSLGGELSVESQLGLGSTFRVTLPAAADDGAAAPERAGLPAPSPATPSPTRRARLLVIDDDPHVGHAVRETLARDHEVVALTSASEALQRLEGGESFDLILCDLMMPMMTGVDLHEILRRARPELAARMVFLTGGAFTARARTFLAEVPNPRLEKPFDPKSLRSFVRQLL
jgi:signal transduction histidine kinase/CheY-like chemotaxis protein